MIDETVLIPFPELWMKKLKRSETAYVIMYARWAFLKDDKPKIIEIKKSPDEGMTDYVGMNEGNFSFILSAKETKDPDDSSFSVGLYFNYSLNIETKSEHDDENVDITLEYFDLSEIMMEFDDDGGNELKRKDFDGLISYEDMKSLATNIGYYESNDDVWYESIKNEEKKYMKKFSTEIYEEITKICKSKEFLEEVAKKSYNIDSIERFMKIFDIKSDDFGDYAGKINGSFYGI